MRNPKSIISTLAIAAITLSLTPISYADPQWPELFREAALPKSENTSPNYQYTSEITQMDDLEWGMLKYNVKNSPELGLKISIESYPVKSTKEDIDKELENDTGDIWCDDYKDVVGGPIDLVSETEEQAVYRFSANPDSGEDKQEKKILSKTMITVNIDKQLKEITEFKYTLTQPVKPVVVAKLDTFEIIGVCESHVNGRPILKQVTTNLSGRALGQDFKQSSLQTYSNVRIE